MESYADYTDYARITQIFEHADARGFYGFSRI